MRYQKEDKKYDLFDINQDKECLVLVFVLSVCKRKILYIPIVIIVFP